MNKKEIVDLVISEVLAGDGYLTLQKEVYLRPHEKKELRLSVKRSLKELHGFDYSDDELYGGRIPRST